MNKDRADSTSFAAQLRNLVLDHPKALADRFAVANVARLELVELGVCLRTSVPTVVLIFGVLALVTFLFAVLPALACRLAPHTLCIGWLVRQLDEWRFRAPGSRPC